MGIDLKSFFRFTQPARAGATQRPPPSTPEAAKARVVDAHRKASAALDRLQSAEWSSDPWAGPSAEVLALKSEAKAAKKELTSALKAFKKVTGQDFVFPRSAPRPDPSDAYQSGKRPGGAHHRPSWKQGPSAGGGPTPKAPDGGAPRGVGRTEGARRGTPSPSEVVGSLVRAATFEARESLLRGVSLDDLTRIERDLFGSLKRSPDLRASLAASTESQRTFNRALFNVHPDKNRTPAARSTTLFDANPDVHQANVENYLAKLDVVRNILNASRQLAENHRFPA